MQRYAGDFRKVNMIYFKINDTDYSNYVSGLSVTKNANYNGLTNAAGDTVVDFLNQKRIIDVVIIPLDVSKLNSLLTAIDSFSMTINFYDPKTNKISENVNVIISDYSVEYYTIQDTKQMIQSFNLSFQEL